MKKKEVIAKLEKAREAATFGKAVFNAHHIPLPTSPDSKYVTEFIQEVTRLYRETWILWYIDEALEELKK